MVNSLERYRYDPFILTAIGLLTPFYTLYYLIHHWNLHDVITLLLVSWAIGINSTIFVHRAWCHRSWVPNRYLNVLGLFLYTIRLVGNSIAWVCVHRQHHRYSDSENDPHSPYYKSRYRIQFLSSYTTIRLGYGADLLRQDIHVWAAKYYWHINVLWWIFLYLVGTLDLWIAVLGLSITKMHTINSLGHNTPQILLPREGISSRNAIGLSLINIDNGEGWHHNHHRDPNNYSFQVKWYEIDPGSYVIRLFVFLGLATTNREQAL